MKITTRDCLMFCAFCWITYCFIIMGDETNDIKHQQYQIQKDILECHKSVLKVQQLIIRDTL